jgi:hypothetical protein
MTTTYFATPADFRTWLGENHTNAEFLLVGFYKKGTGQPSMTWPESADEALYFGWIDGVRINCLSPTMLTESVAYHPYFPGFIPVDAWEVGQAYLRAISNPFTGRILKLHKTDS